MLERLDHFESPQLESERVLADHLASSQLPSAQNLDKQHSPIYYPFDRICSPSEVDEVIEYYGSCGIWVTGRDKDGKPLTNDVLSSERYLSQTFDNGNRADFFMQYHKGFRGQGEGVFNPKSVSWSGDNETIRVLKVERDASTGQVSANYLAAKDMRYAMEDYRRYEENQWRQERLAQVRQELMQMQQSDFEISHLEVAAD